MGDDSEVSPISGLHSPRAEAQAAGQEGPEGVEAEVGLGRRGVPRDRGPPGARRERVEQRPAARPPAQPRGHLGSK